MKKTFLYILIVVIVGGIAYSIFDTATKNKVPGKLTRLPCHKNITAFERAYGDAELQSAKELLLAGNYTIDSDIDKAKYMESTLFKVISIEDTDKYFYNYINKKIKKEQIYNNGIQVEYTIYENDVEDPKKKSNKCKLYRGYVVLKIKNNLNKVVYQVQIDFMDQNGEDVFQTLDCALESFLTY